MSNDDTPLNEESVCRDILAVIDGLAIDEDIPESAAWADLLGTFEYFLTYVLGSLYDEWRHQKSFDGFQPEFAKKIGARAIEVRGDAYLLPSGFGPVHFILEVSEDGRKFRRIECRYGCRDRNRDRSDPLWFERDVRWLDWKLGKTSEMESNDWIYCAGGIFD